MKGLARLALAATLAPAPATSLATFVAADRGRAELELRNATSRTTPASARRRPAAPRINPGDVLMVGGLTRPFVAHRQFGPPVAPTKTSAQCSHARSRGTAGPSD